MSDNSPPLPAKSPAVQENPLLNILLNVLLPVTILSYCSKETGMLALGPKPALILATLLPVGYMIWDYRQRRVINTISIVGIISVLLSGGLGLLEMGAQAFALKEASIPVVLAGYIWFTRAKPSSLTRLLLLNPDIIDTRRVQKEVEARQAQPAFERILHSSAFLLALSLLSSAVMNYFLALYFLGGTVPKTEAYNSAIGKQNLWGFVVIGIPSMLAMIAIFFRMLKAVQKLTGLTKDEVLLPR